MTREAGGRTSSSLDSATRKRRRDNAPAGTEDKHSGCQTSGEGGLSGVSPHTRTRQKGDTWGSSADITSSGQGEPTASAGRKHPCWATGYRTLVHGVPRARSQRAAEGAEASSRSKLFTRKGTRLFNKLVLQEARLTIPLDSVEYCKLSGARLRTCTPGARCPLSTFCII